MYIYLLPGFISYVIIKTIFYLVKYSKKVDVYEKEIEADQNFTDNYIDSELDNDDEVFTLNERLEKLENTLQEQADLLKSMNRIEELSLFIEKEKEKGDLLRRLTLIEDQKLIYEFHLSDFNNFCRLVYDEVKEKSKYKHRSNIMKKLGKMWKDLPDHEKNSYKTNNI